MDKSDRHFFQESWKYAVNNSDDSETKVGAIIVRDSKIISYGANRILLGIEKTPERLKIPEFFDWVYHAERDALSSARNNGISVLGATMYCAWRPCIPCAHEIIASGLSEIVFHQETNSFADSILTDDWGQEKAMKLLEAARHINYRFASGKIFDNDFSVKFLSRYFSP